MNKILHIQKQHAVFIGDFGFACEHRHGALVLLIGLSGPFMVKLAGQEAVHCRSVLIDADVDHTVDCRGEHVATLYFELNSSQAQSLKYSFLKQTKAAFELVDVTFCRKHFERRILSIDLPSLLKYSIERPRETFDPRILSCIDLMQHIPQESYHQLELSQQLGLSNSRLNHLFKQNIGISFRYYKVWSKLAFFMRDFHVTDSLTLSALNSGFSDSSHLSNTYKKAFGISPSQILTNLTDYKVSI